MTQFKSLKYCFVNNLVLNHNLYCPDGDRITRIQLTGNQKLYGVYLSNGQYDILKADTKIQVEKIKQ